MRWLVIAALAACRLDDRPVIVADAPGSNGGPDAPTCLDRSPQIPSPKLHADGKTHAGASCKAAGCHTSPVSGGNFVAAGTIVTQLRVGDGGAYFLFTPAANPRFQLQVSTDAAGNFWIREDGAAAYPGFVGITACPTTKFMPFAVDAEQGSCNDCHNDLGGLSPLIVE